jgi:hypothetical protein
MRICNTRVDRNATNPVPLWIITMQCGSYGEEKGMADLQNPEKRGKSNKAL